MNDLTFEDLAVLAEDDPAVAENVIQALTNVIEFNKGRGAMLRSLSQRPDTQAIANLEAIK